MIQNIVSLLVELRVLFKTARTNMKRMGECAGVDIEPDSQTELADSTEVLNGVLCALVPGAGGVDALVALTLSDAVRVDVEKLWSQWGGRAGNHSSVCPLMLKAETGSLSGVAAHFDFSWE